MKVFCAWCDKALPDKPGEAPPGLPPDAVSHGICEQCREQLVGGQVAEDDDSAAPRRKEG